MLRSFRVENHKSIRDEAELLLMPAYDKTRPVVPVAAIFGANASGKSNLLDALQWMKDAVRNSFGSWEPGRGVPRRPFRLDPKGKTKSSLYAVELLIDDARHMYGFVVDDAQILEEWLYVYPHSRKRIIFERQGSEWTFGSTVARAKVEVLRDLTSGTALFLSVAARADLPEVQGVYAWFQNSLSFNTPGSGPDLTSVAEYLLASEQRRHIIVELVRAADLGVQDIQVDFAEESSAERDVRRNGSIVITGQGTGVQRITRLLPTLSFKHGDVRAKLKAQDQSYGTLAWLRLLVPALSVLDHGGVLCVDEIDSSLHPRLTARLIELFGSEQTNPSGAQLVFTTHDATLLGTSFGRDILARDEIWFVQKAKDGATTLFPLSDFKPRKDENTERRYLGGSYGAVPAVFSETLVDRLAAARQEPVDAAS